MTTCLRSGTESGEHQEVDLHQLLKYILSMKWIVVAVCSGSLALSAVYAYKIAKPEYVSSALLIPTQGSNSSDQLGMAAAIIGKKSGVESSDADLYQGLLTSRTVVRKLILDTCEACSESHPSSGRPFYEILRIDTGSLIAMESAIDQISKSITVAPKDGGSGGILEIRFASSNPRIAQELGGSLLTIGQEELRHIRALRSEVVIPRIANSVNQAKSEWDSAAKRVAWYMDKNRSIVLPEQTLELSRLQMEQQVREQKYMLARKEYETLLFEREKASPPLMILDPPNLPAKKTKPKRGLIMAAGFLFGLIGSVTGLLAWGFFSSEPNTYSELNT